MAASKNLVLSLDGDERVKLGVTLLQWIKDDIESRRDWEDSQNENFQLWAGVAPKRKPAFEGGANVNVPMAFSAVNNWAGLTHSSIFENPYPDRVQAIPTEPTDIERAKRVRGVMNWQTVFEMAGEYERSYDHLLPALAIHGTCFKKVEWDPELKGLRTEFCHPVDVILPNDTKDIRRARRITHRQIWHTDEIMDKVDEGFFDVSRDFGDADRTKPAPVRHEGTVTPNPVVAEEKAAQGFIPLEGEKNVAAVFEIHWKGVVPVEDSKTGEKANNRARWIAWVDNATGEVLRLVRPHKKVPVYFADFHFIPSPVGGYMSYGLLHWLKPINLMMNSIFNLALDTGRLANMPVIFHGHASGLRGRQLNIKPGIGVEVDDATQIVPLKLPGLDNSIQFLMQFLKEFGQDISANTDEIQGRVQKGVREPTVRGQNQRVDRALNRFRVLAKRVFAGMRQELDIMFRLNSVFLPKKKQFKILGSTESAPFDMTKHGDFDKHYHILPTANPDFATDDRRRDSVERMVQFALQSPTIGAINPVTGEVGDPILLNRITKDYFVTFGRPELAQYVPEPPPPSLDPHAENQMAFEGVEEVTPKLGENHKEHLFVHMQFMKTPEFDTWTNDAQERLITHLEDTELVQGIEQQEAANQKAAAAAAQENQTQQEAA